MNNTVLALLLVVIILISGVAGYTIGASGIPARTQTSTTIQMTTVTVISTNLATPTTSIETTNSSTYCIQTGIHGTLYIRVVSDNTNQPVSGANVTATIMNHCGSEYPVSLGLTNSTGYSSAVGWTGNFLVSVEYAGTNYTFPATTSGAVSLTTLSIPSGVAVEKTIACGGLGCVDTTTTATASSRSIAAQSISCSQTYPNGTSGLKLYLSQNAGSSVSLCVRYFSYNPNGTTIHTLDQLTIFAPVQSSGTLKNANTSFSISASVPEIQIGGQGMANEGFSVTYVIKSTGSAPSGTYEIALSSGLYPNDEICGYGIYNFLQVGNTTNPIVMSSCHYIPSPQDNPGLVYSEVVGITNST